MPRSILGWFVLCWGVFLAGAVVVAVLLVALYQQSTVERLRRAETALVHGCDAIAERYRFLLAGTAPAGPVPDLHDPAFLQSLAGAVWPALRDLDGVEGGIWQSEIGPLAYAFPTYGHARGAFTGATAERAGACRDAQGGTLLLDEIGDMPLTMQAKILRVLQERTVQPVGGRPVRLDARILAATHCDLAAQMRAGSFREDLYYRLDVVPIHLPPLRERQSWPGNVRELRNAMERVAVLCRSELVTTEDLGFLVGPAAGDNDGREEAADLPTAVARLEARLITEALSAAGGNRTAAARRLGIHRQLLYAKARRYGLLPPDASEERTEPVAKADTAAGGIGSGRGEATDG
ncbi:sigma 54-interacting transcriptional regulator [Benzoatithermus flavus]|uniref:Sigma 54-interacting transcriptional regulator n=1 Tax=Benzoatithermus flavus TaxID=3108223 RepID=A0ABU8XQ38_9PROT